MKIFRAVEKGWEIPEDLDELILNEDGTVSWKNPPLTDTETE